MATRQRVHRIAKDAVRGRWVPGTKVPHHGWPPGFFGDICVLGLVLHFQKSAQADLDAWAQGTHFGPVKTIGSSRWTQTSGVPTQATQACKRVISAWEAGISCLTMCGQTALSCLPAPSRVFMTFQREQCALDLSGCRARRAEIGSVTRETGLLSSARR